MLGMGLAPGITSISALFVSVVPGLSGTGDIPIGIVVILLLQVAGPGNDEPGRREPLGTVVDFGRIPGLGHVADAGAPDLVAA